MIFRVEVRTAGDIDPSGQNLRQQATEFAGNVGPISTARIFLIDADATEAQIKLAAVELLADPIVETAKVRTEVTPSENPRIEIHLKPGVMDPVATSAEMALRDLGLSVREVRTGRAFVFEKKVDRAILEQIARQTLANGVIETVHFEPYLPNKFPAGQEQPFSLRHISIRDLEDAALQKLSREGHLFLSLAEMKAVQSYFKEQRREPTDVELETIAQTWSEHCVHKTLKSAVEVVDERGKVVRSYRNLIKETIFQSTQELMKLKPGFCLSVFVDNAGVIAFDETDAVCFKVETHNHPSAIEPYGGSATGIGGVIRDVLGTGLAAKPVANTDVFCVALPNRGLEVVGSGLEKKDDIRPSTSNLQPPTPNLPRGVIHPRRILQQIVAGVRDYGNRMGIPTVNGAVFFDDRYLGNPLVFCGCVGLIPRDKIRKEVQAGDAIVLMGGRTGRDGIHGATFSSAQLTDTHADEFSHAVQIGNAITEKKMADVILTARDRNLFSAITDLGAGGLSSAVGEMGAELGATVALEKVPLKYAGLRYDEIWISEAQERMLLSVPPAKVDELLKLAASEDVEATVIGTFGTDGGELILNFHATEVCRLTMKFLHDGLPMPRRKARVSGVGYRVSGQTNAFHPNPDTRTPTPDLLLRLLAHPNIASKHWIIRQYDHEVQGGSVVKPLIGPQQIGPSDASVIRPKLNSHRGVVLACGLAPQITDAYQMTIAAIDEAIRNAVAVGGDPAKLAILDNFCWPSVDDEETMGTLVAACEACRDAAKIYGVPFISGKDSLHNQFTNQETGEILKIPNTLLISAIGIIDDVRTCVTMDLKKLGNKLYLIEPKSDDLAGLAETHRRLFTLMQSGNIAACHDLSDGGLLVAAAEMCIASGLGLNLTSADFDLFGEAPGRYLVESAAAVDGKLLGEVVQLPRLKIGADEISIDDLTAAWRGTLDW